MKKQDIDRISKAIAEARRQISYAMDIIESSVQNDEDFDELVKDGDDTYSNLAGADSTLDDARSGLKDLKKWQYK